MNTTRTSNNHWQVPKRGSLVLLSLLVVLVGSGAVLFSYNGWGSTSFSISDDVRGSGVTATETRQLPAFNGIDLAGVSTVTVHVGATQMVVVRADDNLIKRITTDVQGGTLVVGEHGNFSNNRPLNVDITVPNLTNATLRGSGIIRIDGVHAGRFTVGLPGSGVLTVTGVVANLDANLLGSGDLQLQNLAAHDVTATLSGSGRLQVQATGTLDASIAGSGEIVYSGNPATVKQSISGSGAILEG